MEKESDYMRCVILFFTTENSSQEIDFNARNMNEGFQAGAHDLLIMPTAYTMPKGNAYFSNYELFLLNFGLVLTSSAHLGIMVLFFVFTEFYETI